MCDGNLFYFPRQGDIHILYFSFDDFLHLTGKVRNISLNSIIKLSLVLNSFLASWDNCYLICLFYLIIRTGSDTSGKICLRLFRFSCYETICQASGKYMSCYSWKRIYTQTFLKTYTSICHKSLNKSSQSLSHHSHSIFTGLTQFPNSFKSRNCQSKSMPYGCLRHVLA